VTCEVARRLMALLRIVEQGAAPYGVLGDDALLDAWFGTGSPIPPGQCHGSLRGQLPAALSSVGTSSGPSSSRCVGNERYLNRAVFALEEQRERRDRGMVGRSAPTAAWGVLSGRFVFQFV